MLNESGASAVAIDNKIEQAMDLVNSHLMLAVREEVESIRLPSHCCLSQMQIRVAYPGQHGHTEAAERRRRSIEKVNTWSNSQRSITDSVLWLEV